MSVSQPIPLTPGNINIPAPSLIYLVHLLLYSSGQYLIAHLFFPPPAKCDWWLAAVLQYSLDTLTPGLLIRQVSSVCWGQSHLQISGAAIHLKVRDEPLCCQVKVNRIGWQRRMWAVMEGGDALCSSLPASFAVQLDFAELSAGALCAVISCTGNPRCHLLQVHDWCMMVMCTIDAISHTGKISSIIPTVMWNCTGGSVSWI